MANDKHYIVAFVDFYPEWRVRRLRILGYAAKWHAKESDNVAYIEDE